MIAKEGSIVIGKAGQNSIAELQAKFEQFQPNESSKGVAKFGKTVKKWVQKKSYQSIKSQLVDALLKGKVLSPAIKKLLTDRKAVPVSAAIIMRALSESPSSDSAQQKVEAKPSAKSSAAVPTPKSSAAVPTPKPSAKPSVTVPVLSLPEKVEKLSKDFQSKIDGYEWPEDLLTSTSFNAKHDEGDKKLSNEYSRLPNGGSVDRVDRPKDDKGMFRRYPNFHKEGKESAVTFKNKNFPHQLHANKVELCGQKFIAHEAIEAADGTKKNGAGSFGSLLAMYSEQGIPVSVNLTAPIEGTTAKGYGIGSYVSKEGLEPGSETIVKDLAGESHTLKVLDITTKALSTNPEVTVETVNVSIDGKEHTHIYCKGWPDHGVLSAEVLVELSHMHHQLRGDSTGPSAIHCSAGIGRTGTFIAIDAVVNGEDASGLSAESLITEIRTARYGVVQSAAQYKLVDVVVKHKDSIRNLLHGNATESAGQVKEVAQSKRKTASKPEVLHEEAIYANVNARQVKIDSEPLYANTGALDLTAKEVNDQLRDGTYMNLQDGKVMDYGQFRGDLNKLDGKDISSLFMKGGAPDHLKAMFKTTALQKVVYECHAEKRVGEFIGDAMNDPSLTGTVSKADSVRDKIKGHPLNGKPGWNASALAALQKVWN